MKVFAFLILYIVTLVSFDKVHYELSPVPIDVIIPCALKDRETLELCIQTTRQYVQSVRRIIVISKTRLSYDAEWVDEQLYPFSKREIALELFHQDPTQADLFLHHPQSRAGWIYQQCLKLYAPFVIPNLSDNILVVDADVIWFQPVQVMTISGEPIFTLAFEYNPPYFAHMARVLPGLHRVYPSYSGIAHHMLFQKPILEDLFEHIRKQHHAEPWQALCRCIDPQQIFWSSFSEYEIYFNFTLLRTDQAHLKFRKWADCFTKSEIKKYRESGYSYVSFRRYN